MENRKIVNIPIGKMDMDSFPADVKPTDVRLRVNAGVGTNKFSKAGEVNDRSNVSWIEGMPEKIVGRTTVTERKYWIVFSYNNGESEIGIASWETKKYTKVATDKEFNCDWGFSGCEQINIEYDFRQACKDLTLYFSAKTIYYHINLDELIDKERKNGLLKLINGQEETDECQKYDCSYFKNFKCVCGVKSNAYDTKNGGYDLPAGAYQVFVRLIDRSGTYSNVFRASSQINIGSEDNIPGQRSDSCININISNLPCNYHIVEIILASKISGIETAKIIASRIYTNGKISYTYCGKNNEEIPISPDTLRFRGRTIFKGKDLKIKGNKMWYYNILPKKNPDLQKKVIEQTVVKLKPYIVPYKDVKKYGLKSLMRSERYLFSLNFNTCEYGGTPAYVLSPSNGKQKFSQKDFINFIKAQQPDLSTIKYDNGKVVRLQDDCKIGNTGNHSGGGCGRGGNCGLCDGGEAHGGCGGNECLGYRSAGNDGSGSSQKSSFSDKLEENIDSTNTTLDEVCDTIDCNMPESSSCDCPCDECECEKDKKGAKECNDSLPGLKNTIIDWMDRIAAYAEDGYEPTQRSSSLKEAAKNLMKKAVKKREQIYQSKDTIKISRKSNKNKPQAMPSNPMSNETTGDKTVNADGYTVLAADVDRTSTPMSFKVYETNNKYPDTLNCEGKPIYGNFAGKPLQLFEVPSASEIPLFLNINGNEGVLSNSRPDGDESGEHYMILIGLDVSNIPIPTNDELGATLCKTNPFHINMAERDFANSRVLAKGILIGGFYGNVNGKKYIYAKHAVNSVEYVDRYIDDNGSRKGIESSDDTVFFHSLDTNIYHLGLAPTHIQVESIYKGVGERYGLYAKGSEPQDRFSGRRIDMRGARSATSLSHFDIPDESDTKLSQIQGISYVKPNGITVAEGIDFPVMNKGREGLIVVKSQNLQKIIHKYLFDYSFLGVTIDHRIPANGRTVYAALLRDNPDQYGSVISQSYVSLNLSGTSKSLETHSVSGICGDVYIGYDSIRRTSYISDKVGEEYPIGEIVDGKQRSRTVCDPPDNWDFNEMGAWNPMKLPKSGDLANAKNWAGLRTTLGGHPFTFDEVVRFDIDSEGFPNNYNNWSKVTSFSDVFYPSTLTHLIGFWGETRVCPWLRQTGEGIQRYNKKVFYPNLKDLELDSTLMGGSEEFGVEWDLGWLNEYHVRVEQPSKAQLVKKFFYKQLINTLMPIGEALFLAQVDSAVGAATTGLITPILIAIWVYIKLNYFTDEKINELCGIPNCRTDSEGGIGDRWIEGYQDNYWKYNWDYSENFKIEVIYGLPDPYYTCNCELETTNDIMVSAKKMEGAAYDGYLSVSPFSKLSIPLHSGKLQLLFTYGNGYFALTSDRIMVVKDPPTSIATAMGGSLRIGGASNLTEPRPYFEELIEGRWGTIDPNASIATPWGQLIIDTAQNNIHLFNGRSVETLSNNKMRRWFQNNMSFNCQGCRDEKQEYGYSTGIDYHNEMIFITKRDCECSWTLAYKIPDAETKGGWHSFYEFKPQWYFWNRKDFFTQNLDKLWKHGVGQDFLKYYDKNHSYIVEIILSLKGKYGENIPYLWKSTELDTVMRENELFDRMGTFNKIAIYGDLMNTGVKEMQVMSRNDRVAMTIDDKDYCVVKRSGTRFNINDLRNFAKENSIINIDNCPFNDIAKVSKDIVPENLYGDYFIMRLIYNGNNELITKSVIHTVNVRDDG